MGQTSLLDFQSNLRVAWMNFTISAHHYCQEWADFIRVIRQCESNSVKNEFQIRISDNRSRFFMVVKKIKHNHVKV